MQNVQNEKTHLGMKQNFLDPTLNVKAWWNTSRLQADYILYAEIFEFMELYCSAHSCVGNGNWKFLNLLLSWAANQIN